MDDSAPRQRRPARWRRRPFLFVGLMAVALSGLPIVGASPASAAPARLVRQLGVYEGSGDVAGVQAFEGWLGRSVSIAHDFLPDSTWEDIANPWNVGRWAPTRYRMLYSVPLIPATGGTLQAGAAGNYNTYFVRLAQLLVAKGESDAILRLGWEFNGGWYRWTAKNDPAAFSGYWRQVVNAMRSVTGAAFTFDWAPNLGTAAVAPDRAWPGDAYVDFVGLSAYDQGWNTGWTDPVKRWDTMLTQPYGLQWQRWFAAAHNKRMSYPEWGLAIRNDGHGGGDNTEYIDRMFDWVRDNSVAHFVLFNYDSDVGKFSLSHFPTGGARFRERFGPTYSIATRNLSVFAGPGNTAGAAAFGGWLGRSPAVVSDQVPGGTWSEIESVWMASRWAATGQRKAYTVPLLPANGGTLSEGAAGAYNGSFVKLAQRLVANGQGNAILRLGPGFNTSWVRWTAKTNPSAYAAYWRQVVTAMRSVSGNFRFEWAPSLGEQAAASESAWPGDTYVDYVGLTVYDQGWSTGWTDPVKRWNTMLTQRYGLQWHRDFAAAHNKSMSFPEWGLASRSDGHGGGDNPYFVQRMKEWITAHDVAYHAYWNVDYPTDKHTIPSSPFPNAGLAFQEAFRVGS
jgi:beta-mannanase